MTGVTSPASAGLTLEFLWKLPKLCVMLTLVVMNCKSILNYFSSIFQQELKNREERTDVLASLGCVFGPIATRSYELNFPP